MTAAKTSSTLSIAATIGAAALLIYGWVHLGPAVVALFMAVIAVGMMDALTGKVNIFMFAPCVVLPFISWPATIMFCPILSACMIVWSAAGLVALRWPHLGKFTLFGFGDVLGIPMAITLSEILVPRWGIVVFAAVLLCETPLLIKRTGKGKPIRLLAWLVIPAMVTFIVAVFT